MDEEEIVAVRSNGSHFTPPGIVFLPYTMVQNSETLIHEGTFNGLRVYNQIEVNPNFFGRISLSKQFKFGRGYI